MNGQNLVLDPFLSENMGVSSYRIADAEQDFEIPSSPSFIYTKVATSEIERLHFLTARGFFVIDTLVSFAKDLKIPTAPQPNPCRAARDEDRARVTHIAEQCFSTSRFHLDPLIPTPTANKIKRAWVDNFFLGKRGDHMVVACDGPLIVGFNLILAPEPGIKVIDLIGVDKSRFGRGYGKAMVDWLEAHSPGTREIRVGTQAANIGAVRFYENLGFRLVSSHYVLHRRTRS